MSVLAAKKAFEKKKSHSLLYKSDNIPRVVGSELKAGGEILDIGLNLLHAILAGLKRDIVMIVMSAYDGHKETIKATVNLSIIISITNFNR